MFLHFAFNDFLWSSYDKFAVVVLYLIRWKNVNGFYDANDLVVMFMILMIRPLKFIFFYYINFAVGLCKYFLFFKNIKKFCTSGSFDTFFFCFVSVYFFQFSNLEEWKWWRVETTIFLIFMIFCYPIINFTNMDYFEELFWKWILEKNLLQVCNVRVCVCVCVLLIGM